MKLQRFVNDIENQIINLKNKYLKPKYVSVNKKGMEIFKKYTVMKSNGLLTNISSIKEFDGCEIIVNPEQNTKFIVLVDHEVEYYRDLSHIRK